jgi:hypothetical protein
MRSTTISPNRSTASSPDAADRENESGPGSLKKGVSRRSTISIDKTGTIISCNNAARILFGFPTLNGLIGSNVAILMPAPFNSQHQSYIQRYLSTMVSHGAIGEWKGGYVLFYRITTFNQAFLQFVLLCVVMGDCFLYVFHSQC